VFNPEPPRIDQGGNPWNLALEFEHRRLMVARRRGGTEGIEGRRRLLQLALDLG